MCSIYANSAREAIVKMCTLPAGEGSFVHDCEDAMLPGARASTR